MTPHLFSSKASFGALILAAVISLSGIVVFVSFSSLAASRENAVRRAEMETRNLAQAIDQNITASLQRVDHTLRSVTGELEGRLATGTLDLRWANHLIATEQKLLPEAVAIRVTNADGTVIINNPTGDPGASLRDRPFFPVLRDHPETGVFVTKPILGLFMKQWVITSARRYNLPDGRFGGVVVAPVLIEHFQKALSGFEIGPGGMLSLRDADGGFVARHPVAVNGERLEIGDHALSPELQRILASGVDHATYFTEAPSDKTPRTAAYRRIAPGHLVVLASLTEADYLAQWRRDRLRVIVVAGFFLLGAWMMAWWLWRLWEQRERDTAALVASEERYQDYLAHAIDVIFTLDGRGNFLAVSPAWERQFGFPASEVFGHPFAPFVHPDDVQPCMDYLRRVLTTGQAEMSPTYRVKHADGSWRWLRADGTRIITATGELQYSGVAHDITDRKRAEDALRKSNAYLENLINFANAPIIVWNPQFRITRFNHAFEHLTGRTEAEVLGLTLESLFPPDEAEASMALIRLTQSGERWESVEIRIQHKDGSIRTVLWNSATLFEADGQTPMATIAQGQDITVRLEALEKQRQLQLQLHQAQKLDSLGSLAGGVAHDMNNVLGAILVMASAHLESQAEGSSAHRAFDTIAKAALRGGQMVKSLLAFSHQSPAEERELDVNGILREEVHLLQHTTLAKVRLELDLAEDLHPIKGDANALNHAFMNLCVNAVDAMPESGTLTLRTCNDGADWIEVMVEDTGLGMSKEVREKALDPFFTTKEVGKGTGLGLSMVYSIVKAHGGQVDIQSQPGRGTRVNIRFPACQRSKTPAAITVASPALASGRALKVLLVDDDNLVRGSIADILSVLGHHPTEAPSGEEALGKVEGGLQPDVVILDMNMPGIGGAGTLPQLRRLLPTVPVLLATGRMDQEALDLERAYLKVFLLPKPFQMKDLRKKLEEVGQLA